MLATRIYYFKCLYEFEEEEKTFSPTGSEYASADKRVGRLLRENRMQKTILAWP